MMPPTSIDGTDITGATIDGTDVTEITVDGDTVFSAAPSNLPVAYSNLVAWYPFDSATYGGSNADDVTAILGGSGDDTAYNGTVNGPTYESSGGVTDINAGANSGAFEFDEGTTDHIELSGLTQFDGSPGSDFTTMGWVFFTGSITGQNILLCCPSQWTLDIDTTRSDSLNMATFGGNTLGTFSSIPRNTWTHFAVYWNPGNTTDAYINGSFDASDGNPDTSSGSANMRIGDRGAGTSVGGELEDIRIYDGELTGSQINQIYQNTKP